MLCIGEALGLAQKRQQRPLFAFPRVKEIGRVATCDDPRVTRRHGLPFGERECERTVEQGVGGST